MKLITYDLLVALEACRPALAAFKKRFPNGATWVDTIDAALEADHPAWVSWLARYCPSIDGATWEARLALQRYGFERAWLGQYCPAGVAGSTWAARMALQQDDGDRSILGRVCPAIDGATWAVRLALQRSDFQRAELGRTCPDVEGATWEARSALQQTNYQRALLGRVYPAGVEGDPR